MDVATAFEEAVSFYRQLHLKDPVTVLLGCECMAQLAELDVIYIDADKEEMYYRGLPVKYSDDPWCVEVL